MATVRYFLPALVGGLLWAGSLGAQTPTGTIVGRVVDQSTQQPVVGATVTVDGTGLATLTQREGNFVLSAVPAGTHILRVSLIGYAPQQQEVRLESGATATVRFGLQPEALVLEEVVVTGYGSQRREAITGSVARIGAEEANVGVITNANEMMQGRVAGLSMTMNNGEPGAGAQVRIRGGTSISASNEPLYVIDGVPIQNVETEAAGIGIGGSPSLPRSALTLLNPSDIASITVLKDASAAAIYGSRAANGVVLIETKRGAPGGVAVEYDTYIAAATPARYLDVLSGAQYRQFIEQQVAAGNLSSDRLTNLGPANTNWERELTRTALTQNHNLSFSGGKIGRAHV